MLLKHDYLIFSILSCRCIKEKLLETGFIEKMRTIWGNKEVSQTFFNNSLYSRKYDLIRFTPTIGNAAFRIFMTLQKADFTKFLAGFRLLPTISHLATLKQNQSGLQVLFLPTLFY